MILLVAATEMEAAGIADLPHGPDRELLLCGVGLLETAVRLTRRLGETRRPISMVIHFGVAGAYPGSGAGLLDLCLAERELLGDFGICRGEATEPLPGSLVGKTEFDLDQTLLVRAETTLNRAGLFCRRGTFVTVSGVSATTSRGLFYHKACGALCENMEGAAVARVCAEFAVPCLELRAISNLVEDRDPSRWQLSEAVRRCGEALAVLLDPAASLEEGHDVRA